MKRKAFIMAMVMCMMGSTLGTTGMTVVQAEENTAETGESTENEESTEAEANTDASTEAEDTLAEGQVLLPASEAVFTEGEGVGPDNEKEPTSYDEEVGMIRAVAREQKSYTQFRKAQKEPMTCTLLYPRFWQHSAPSHLLSPSMTGKLSLCL